MPEEGPKIPIDARYILLRDYFAQDEDPAVQQMTRIVDFPPFIRELALTHILEADLYQYHVDSHPDRANYRATNLYLEQLVSRFEVQMYIALELGVEIKPHEADDVCLIFSQVLRFQNPSSLVRIRILFNKVFDELFIEQAKKS